MKNIEKYTEKLNWFLQDIFEQHLTQKTYLLRAELDLLSENKTPYLADMAVLTKRYAFAERKIYPPFSHLIGIHFDTLILGQELRDKGNMINFGLIPIRNLCVLFQFICLRDFDFKCESIFLNKALINEKTTELYKNLKQQQTILLDQELEKFLCQYPDLLELFYAIHSLNLNILAQQHIINIVKELNILNLFHDFCLNIKQGIIANKTELIFYVLKEAVQVRYFSTTGNSVWQSDEYRQRKEIIMQQLRQQETLLIQHVKENYLLKFEHYFLNNKEITELNKELFPQCSIAQFEQDCLNLINYIQEKF